MLKEAPPGVIFEHIVKSDSRINEYDSKTRQIKE